VLQVDAIIIATGSEVGLGRRRTASSSSAAGKSVRVVSMPSVDAFMAQMTWRTVMRIAFIRACACGGGSLACGLLVEICGLDGHVIGMTTFGESAPAGKLYAHFGITTEAVVAAVNERV
jgi:transketolase